MNPMAEWRWVKWRPMVIVWDLPGDGVSVVVQDNGWAYWNTIPGPDGLQIFTEGGFTDG